MWSIARSGHGALLASLFVLMSVVEGKVLLTELPRTLVVQSEIQGDGPEAGPAKAGEDRLLIRWALNETVAEASTALYAKVNIKLCYAPVSQVNRGWRKKNNDLHKDKTCPKGIVKQKFALGGNSTVWRITKDVPGATYFVRAYVLNANGTQVAYGQTTNAARTTNLFSVEPITGRHTTIDIAAAVFSAFSIGSLIFFLAMEQIKQKRNEGGKS